MLDRRSFLKGLVATTAGVLIPGSVAAEPDRRVWALDRTMVAPEPIAPFAGFSQPIGFITDDPMKRAFDIVFRWDDGFEQTVNVTHQDIYSGARIPLARGGVFTGWQVAPIETLDAIAVDLWPEVA